MSGKIQDENLDVFQFPVIKRRPIAINECIGLLDQVTGRH